MNEESRRLQEKLRAKVSQALAVSARVKETSIIAFETTTDVLPGSEDLVDRVVDSLEQSGRVVRRIGKDSPFAAKQDLEGVLDSLGEGIDVVVCEGFGYKPIPKILVTKKVEEGLNMGLPQIIGYVADRDARALIPRFAPDDAKGIARFIEENIIGGGING